MKPLLRIPNFDNRHTPVLCVFYENTQYAQQRKVTIDISQELQSAREYLANLYEQGWGLKILARELGLSYTKTRTLFNRLNIPIRKGHRIVTEQCRVFRKTLADTNDNPWRGWTSKEKFRAVKMGRGIQGSYTKQNGDIVWLRSTWEYIYAKWLDSQEICWTTETQQYQLSDGTGYRPDFNILDNEGKLERIVEVKGYYKNRLYKAQLLRDEYNVAVEVIDDITPYTTLGYNKEKRLWKALAQSKFAQFAG